MPAIGYTMTLEAEYTTTTVRPYITASRRASTQITELILILLIQHINVTRISFLMLLLPAHRDLMLSVEFFII